MPTVAQKAGALRAEKQFVDKVFERRCRATAAERRKLGLAKDAIIEEVDLHDPRKQNQLTDARRHG